MALAFCTLVKSQIKLSQDTQTTHSGVAVSGQGTQSRSAKDTNPDPHNTQKKKHNTSQTTHSRVLAVNGQRVKLGLALRRAHERAHGRKRGAARAPRRGLRVLCVWSAWRESNSSRKRSAGGGMCNSCKKQNSIGERATAAVVTCMT